MNEQTQRDSIMQMARGAFKEAFCEPLSEQIDILGCVMTAVAGQDVYVDGAILSVMKNLKKLNESLDSAGNCLDRRMQTQEVRG